jgi:hypothetical protein
MKASPITIREQVRIFVSYCIERDTLVRSIKTALVVGTILALINHGQDMLSGEFSWRWMAPMLLTYLVPFSVATYGQVQGKRQRDRLKPLPLDHLKSLPSLPLDHLKPLSLDRPLDHLKPLPLDHLKPLPSLPLDRLKPLPLPSRQVNVEKGDQMVLRRWS